jgi:hypothetical protein
MEPPVEEREILATRPTLFFEISLPFPDVELQRLDAY